MTNEQQIAIMTRAAEENFAIALAQLRTANNWIPGWFETHEFQEFIKSVYVGGFGAGVGYVVKRITG